jgi:DNA topoisomerase-1
MSKYTLIVAEKPDSAFRIATALDQDGKPKKAIISGVPYYQAYRDGDIIVVPALGHLYTVASKNKGNVYPVLDYHWVPRYQAERGAKRIRIWLKVIADLAKDAASFVDACDFDIEGSIIGFTILKYACGGKEKVAKRMKYSTLTTEELQESYNHLLPALDFSLIEAGLARHEVDWLYGVNLSRALTQAAQKVNGQYVSLSTGRVQGPTLRFLETRQKAINCFVPTPYWVINAKISINSIFLDVVYNKILTIKAEAIKIKDACKDKEGKIESISVEKLIQNPPIPFDLGSLQSEVYRVFKYSPAQTSNILQHLYLAALISYPRTSSQKLPSSIGYKTILKKLENIPLYAKHSTDLLSKPSLKPNEGKKNDPAHPAIYPTGNLPEKPLDTSECNVFDIVVKRFLAVFGEPSILQKNNLIVNIVDNRFNLVATSTLSEGWQRFYKPYVQTRKLVLPHLFEGQSVMIDRVTLIDHFTKPPNRYNPCSLLLKMEKEEIGTKATRAAIIQTLLDRKYLNGKEALIVSDLGFKIVEVLARHCSLVVSSQMTRKLEQEMEAIQMGQETKQKVIQDATEALVTISSEFKEKEEVIGAQLFEALQKAQLESRTVGICSTCRDGKLVILRSKKSGKRFVGCTNFFAPSKCRVTFPLPQKGIIKPLKALCKSCSSPKIAVYNKGRTPWRLCLNPGCPSKGAQPK